MDLSFKIIDPDSSAIVDIGHFSFTGSESSLTFRAQIIDNDDSGRPYYLGVGASVALQFAGGVTSATTIESNRSLINATLDTDDLEVMLSGDLNGTINSSTQIKLGNCLRRLSAIETGSVGGSDSNVDDGRVRTSAADGSSGYLADEIIVAGDLTKEIVDDPTYGKVLKLTVADGTQPQTLTNLTGATILEGRVVKLVGTDSIGYSNNTSLANANAIGVTLSTILHGDSGSVATGGVIDVTLLGISSGDVLYLGAANGEITNVSPTTPGSVIFKVGDYNSGKIFLRLETIGVN
jgi:hypothetical protein